jgi:hypothetical protein
VTSHEWDHDRGMLRLTMDHTGDGSVRLAARAHAIVDQDGSGSILDVDMIGLPPLVLPHLREYRTRQGGPMPPSGIALDLDAAWLWLHLTEGTRAHRMAGSALVWLYLSETRLCRIEIRFLAGKAANDVRAKAGNELATTTN